MKNNTIYILNCAGIMPTHSKSYCERDEKKSSLKKARIYLTNVQNASYIQETKIT